MILYMDITQLEKGRANTGIQRVVKEFLQRAVYSNDMDLYLISYNSHIKEAELLDNVEVKLFLKDIKHYQFKDSQIIDIENIKVSQNTVFFDMDAVWNSPLKRERLYPILKANGFLIFNFIYDLVPVLLPETAHQVTTSNFIPYMDMVYKYSDLVFFDSHSAKQDFFDYRDKLGITKDYSTKVIPLGSDFKTISTAKPKEYETLLSSKYILFVGTLEPRKYQHKLLDAFDTLSKKYKDLNLVFIGKQGWKVDELAHKIKTHPLKDKSLFWFENIDDDTLNHFYKNAFIVTYLSQYEGYGLPIAESLNFGNVTIASKNSSMYEVGQNYADYVVYESESEIVDIISLYYEDEQLYNAKKEYVKKEYRSVSWSDMYHSLETVLENYQNSIVLTRGHLQKLQFVFISIDHENLKGTIEAIDKYIDFVKEYIIVTSPSLVEKFNSLSSVHNIKVIDETTILREYAKDFQTKDHVTKNWLLRTSLLNIDDLEDEFIMLDDDNRPIENIDISFFITQEGKYNCYYFYDLLEWNLRDSDYDLGQHNMLKVLRDKNLETLSYSSHAPQIINKKILKEVVDEFFDIGLETAIDEWSIYFNYANSKYTYAFNKRLFQTLNWPALLTDWDYLYIPKKYSFENYYKHLYEQNILSYTMTSQEKIALREAEIKKSRKRDLIFDSNKKYIEQKGLVYGALNFKYENAQVSFFNIPKEIRVPQKTLIRLKSSYKLLNCKDKDVVFIISNNDKEVFKTTLKPTLNYEEDILMIPLHSGLFEEEGKYLLNIKTMIDDTVSERSYKVTLDINDKEREHKVKNIIYKERVSLKHKIKSIPIIGWFARWTYNLLRLNNIKHNLFMLQDHVDKQNITVQNLQHQINQQQNQISRLTAENERLILEIENQQRSMKNSISKEVSKEMLYQSQAFQQRIDQFIFDANIDIKNKTL